MKKGGFSSEALISWHRAFHDHPIASPDYARENLVSLAETLVMLYFYFSLLVLGLHYFVLLGDIQAQTIPWALVEGSTNYLLYRLPPAVFDNKLDVFWAIITTVVAARLTRHSFELIKADLHPKIKGRAERSHSNQTVLQ